ncbi:TetR/AcrR family transcriptional regulator [Streptomyces liangshanensis]|uniref:TetR/AcrR family transcriptional regulator n=1 Tax=Streptomyces liangshanensis TaxID=2717324 RepID=A0A6G9GS10_9ACTN|nr:TetR/AcrR family transcriptional regulator [Streptomyces liangshanensis]QIQ01032.1 TetR/AcrR family transcriptional regulator [Streptomyces liangshanensis]
MTDVRAADDRAAVIEAGALAAVERLLAAGTPYSGLSMQRIADEAGVARSTLYLYFREKNALLIRLSSGLKDGSYQLMSSWSPDGPDALDRLSDTIRDVIAYYRRRRHLLRATLESADRDPEMGRIWADELDPFQELCRHWIRTAQAQGRTAADVDPVTASQVIVIGGFRVIAQQAVAGDPDRDATVAHELAANQWYGAFRRPA